MAVFAYGEEHSTKCVYIQGAVFHPCPTAVAAQLLLLPAAAAAALNAPLNFLGMQHSASCKICLGLADVLFQWERRSSS